MKMGLSDHLTCVLRSLHTGQEATVRTKHGTTDWFQVGKGVRQGCILSRCLFAVYIMGNARLDEAQARIKISGRNISNLRYADDTTLMEESKEEPQTSSIQKGHPKHRNLNKMKRQTNIQQVKENDKCPPNKTKE